MSDPLWAGIPCGVEVDAATLERARRVVLPFGEHRGRSLGSVLARGDAGIGYLSYLLSIRIDKHEVRWAVRMLGTHHAVDLRGWKERCARGNAR